MFVFQAIEQYLGNSTQSRFNKADKNSLFGCPPTLFIEEKKRMVTNSSNKQICITCDFMDSFSDFKGAIQNK